MQSGPHGADNFLRDGLRLDLDGLRAYLRFWEASGMAFGLFRLRAATG